jgi:hypothetical protein
MLHTVLKKSNGGDRTGRSGTWGTDVNSAQVEELLRKSKATPGMSQIPQ